jgi:hypothetical protein
MSRCFISQTSDGVVHGGVDDTLGRNARRNVTLLQGRFPGSCPYHLLHNLLGGHYSRAPQCTASPYTDAACRHGSHSRPGMEMDEYAHCPSVGAVVLLPFGLSYRVGNPGSLTVGCYECSYYGDAMACAACRRRWDDGVPFPATPDEVRDTAYQHAHDCACGGCPPVEVRSGGGGFQGGEEDEDGEEEWGGEEGYGEEEYDEEEYGEEDGVEEWNDEAAWHGEEEYGEEQEEEAEEEEGEVERDWGDGRWEETAHGTAWVVDYRSRESAPAPAPAPDTSVAGIAAAAAQAAVAALMASGAGAAAGEPLPATDSDWERRVRRLELESELAELKHAKRVRR